MLQFIHTILENRLEGIKFFYLKKTIEAINALKNCKTERKKKEKKKAL